MLRRTIAIDFDGTICTNAWPEIGRPIWPVIEKAKEAKANGAALILWTNREGKMLDYALQACALWGLKFDAVNDSTDEYKAYFGNNPRKVGASEYWDDKNTDLRRLLRGDENESPD